MTKWEIEAVSDLKEAQKLAAEGWEPYAVTEGHTPIWETGSGGGGELWCWFYLRRQITEESK